MPKFNYNEPDLLPEFEDCGVVSVVYGPPAQESYTRLVESLRSERLFDNYRLACIAKQPPEGVKVLHLPFPDNHIGARRAKLNIDLLTPFQYTLYLDADTIVQQDIGTGFKMLAQGWDLVIVPSRQQSSKERFWHVGSEEIQYTYDTVGYTPIQLQGGVFYFNKDSAAEFFAEWRNQWELYQDQDQAALVRALHKVPIKVWLLGQPYNNGSVVKHRFGQARRHK